jgi:hypothetical protein
LPAIAARGDVINAVGDLNTRCSRHAWNLGAERGDGALIVAFSSTPSTFLDMSGVRPRT